MVLKPPRLTPEEYVHFFSAYDRVSPLLISDYDGTLAPFRKEREKAVPGAQTQDLLGAIQTRRRSDPRLGKVRRGSPAACISSCGDMGCHGMERLGPDGLLERAEVSPEALSKMNEFSWLFGDFPNRSVEVKYSGIALHWRENRETADRYAEFSRDITNAATEAGLRILPFDGGIEFMMPDFSKGNALRRICSEHPYSSPICYMGDDMTDEDAFVAVREREAGVAILVFSKLRESHANVSIHNSEVNTFLEFWLHRMAKKGNGTDER